jgi:hypothetical protein
MAGLGPMAGQNHHFSLYAPEKIPYAIDRYVRETGRLYGVLNKRLADREFVAGDYSIADMACYPWVLPERQGQNLDDFPHLKRWKAEIGARPAVLRAYEIAKSVNQQPGIRDDKARAVLFGQDRNTVKGRAAPPRLLVPMANFAPLKRHMFDGLDRSSRSSISSRRSSTSAARGRRCRHLARRGWRGTAIDASPAAIGRARARAATVSGRRRPPRAPRGTRGRLADGADVGRARAPRRRPCGARLRRAPDGARRPSPARGPQQPARVALVRRLLRPRPPLHVRRPAPPRRGCRARR